MRVMGVEVTSDQLRAVVIGRRSTPLTLAVPFSRERIDDAVADLFAQSGDVNAVGLAIGLAHLQVKQVALPPVTHAARRQMLLVEPDRWFAVPVGSLTAVALSESGETALGADGAFVEALVAAFDAWAPVTRVDAAPTALLGAPIAWTAGATTFRVEAGAAEVGLVTIADGAIRQVRRVRAVDYAGGDARATGPTVDGVGTDFAVALGVARSLDGATESMLLTPLLEQRFVRAQWRRAAGWVAAAALAVGVALWSADRSRERVLTALEEQVAVSRTAAATGATLAQRALTINRELAAVTATVQARSDVPAALAALGSRLPQEAVAQRIRVSGNSWQVEGNAVKAAAVLAALAAEPTFDEVRFLAPSNRFRDGTDDRETFAIAFVVR